MSFERTQYDPCTYKYDLSQSMRVGNYAFETPTVHCGNCFFPDPYIRVQRGGGGAAVCAPAHLTDVDSELMGLNRRYSRCPEEQGPSGFSCETTPPPDCTSALFTEATRLSNPPCTLRCTGWNRWAWLHHDPQEHSLLPFQTNISNRIIVKDNHRPCLTVPRDQTGLLPKERDEPPPAVMCAMGPPIPMYHWRSADEISQL